MCIFKKFIIYIIILQICLGFQPILAKTPQKPQLGIITIDAKNMPDSLISELKKILAQSIYQTNTFSRIVNKPINSITLPKKKVKTDDKEDLYKKAKMNIDLGKLELKQNKYAEAIDKFQAAILSLINSVASWTSNNDIIKAHLYLAFAYSKKEISTAVMTEFQKLLTIDPTFDLPKNMFSKSYSDLFMKTKTKLLSANKSYLNIKTNPNSSSVFINGKEINRKKIIKLIPGTHYLTVKKKGYDTYFEKLELNPGDKKKITISLEGGKEDINSYFGVAKNLALIPIERLKFLSSLSENMKVGYLLLASTEVKDDEITIAIQIINTKLSILSKIVSMTMPVKKLSKEINLLTYTMGTCINYLGQMEDQCIIKSSDNIFLPLATKSQINYMKGDVSSLIIDSTPIYEKWWFWTIIGGTLVTIGAAIATYFLVFKDNTPNDNPEEAGAF
ncbi:MAG: PEGA domain-containing protein [Pseudomonadota bacterium]